MINAKKSLGQNFLKDETIKDKIIKSMPNTTNTVLEIGPGLGDLTEKLLQQRDVVAVEIDKVLYEGLRVKFFSDISSGNLRLINADINRVKKSSILNGSYDAVANLPYYIATAIILDLLKDSHCKNILVMVQKEVAQKFTAKAKESGYSSLSIITQTVGSATYLFDVPKEAFIPMPKVTSAVFKIEKHSGSYDEEFALFLKKAFLAPRKKLIKNLSKHFNLDLLALSFKELNLKDTIRPHEVDATDFFHLFKLINTQN